MRPLLLANRFLNLPYPLAVYEEARGVLRIQEGHQPRSLSARDLQEVREHLLALPYDRVVLLPPFGIRMLPFLPRLDQESVDIRSTSMLLKTSRGFLGIHPLWRALRGLVEMKNRVVGVVGSGHTGRSALYAARRAGSRKLRLITRRAPIDTLKLFDVFSLTFHPRRPLQAFLQEVDVLFWCSLQEPEPSFLEALSPDVTVVDVRLPSSLTPWPGRVIRGEAVLVRHLEASRAYPVDV